MRTTVRMVRELRSTWDSSRLVNLTGPLDVGKSRLSSRIGPAARVDLDRPDRYDVLQRALADPESELLVVDSTDSARRREALRRALGLHPGPVVLVTSRMPQAATPLVGLRCCDGRVGPGLRRPNRSAGGRPRRPGRQWQRSSRKLTTVRTGDEYPLRGSPEHFTFLAAFSIVRRVRLGLELVEPYRSLFEPALRWRKPESHRTTRTRAREYRLTAPAVTERPGPRADLAEEGPFLSGDPLVRREPFPARDSQVRVRTAGDQDANDRVLGLAGLMPVSPRTADSLSPPVLLHGPAARSGSADASQRLLLRDRTAQRL
ncbi:hypothetical protein [Streptomyces prasinus]|uniref:hypothetical protein n=1 Tax=Streptomyces prasinus TaxID=67345 RepID=UPI0036AB4083